jgi:hypothetical protein
MRIGSGPEPQQAGDGGRAEARVPRLADCNLAARRDESSADDLVARPGHVSGRVALLLRAAECHPASARFEAATALPRRGARRRAGPRGGRLGRGPRSAVRNALGFWPSFPLAPGLRPPGKWVVSLRAGGACRAVTPKSSESVGGRSRRAKWRSSGRRSRRVSRWSAGLG